MPSLQTPQTKRHRLAGLSSMAVMVLALASLSAGSSDAAEDPRYPGLPKAELSGGWAGPRATGFGYVRRAKQWARVPSAVLAASVPVAISKTDNSVMCQRLFPYKRTDEYSATAFFKSPAGAPAPYGYLGPFTTRTVAFGSIPVEASIELRQLRDEENLPIGLPLEQKTGIFCTSAQGPPFPNDPLKAHSHWQPAKLNGQLDVAVTALKVDGVDLKLGGSCRTSKPGTIALKSREFYNRDPSIPAEKQPTPENLLTTDYFGMATGGLLEGAVDIPAFAGCTTRTGEDISRLLTATVSGPDNPVMMRSEGLQAEACIAAGVTCPPLPDLPFPTGN